MKQDKTVLGVTLTGHSTKMFERVAAYYKSLDDPRESDQITRSGVLRELIISEYLRLLADKKITPINDNM